MILQRSSGTRAAIGAACVLGLVTIGAAPTHAQMGAHESEGTAAGSLFGGIIGGVLGGHGGAAIGGALAGAAIGGLIGNRVGAALDEEDRAALARTTRRAMVTGKTRRYSNKRTGVKARAEVVSSRRVEGRQCRTVKQEVVLKDGSKVSDIVRACKGPNGWEV